MALVDAFSRCIVDHRLLTELSGAAVSVELEAALANCTGAKPRIVHDHGSEFCNAELRAVIKAHDLIDIRTRARHPESNGIVERWNGTVRRESETTTETTTSPPSAKCRSLSTSTTMSPARRTRLLRTERTPLRKSKPAMRRPSPTSSYPHDIDEESTTAAKWPLNRAQPL